MARKRSSDPMSVDEVKSVAFEIHSSLKMVDILRTCRRVLSTRFVLGRLTLVQQRSTEFTATRYALNEDGDAPLIGPEVIPLEHSRLQECMTERRKIIAQIDNKSQQDNMSRKYFAQQVPTTLAYVPLTCKEQSKGILVMDFPEGVRLDAHQEEFLEYVTSLVALAIENSDTHYMERRRRRQLGLVSDIAKEAVALENVQEFLARAVRIVREGFDYSTVQIWNPSSNQERLALRASDSKFPVPTGAEAFAPPMVEQCWRDREAISSNNLLMDGRFGFAREGIVSQLTIPIRLRGKPLGVLSTESHRLDAFAPDDVGSMEGVASLIAAAFDNLRILGDVQQSNEYMQAILDSAREIVILSTDINGYVITASAGTRHVFELGAHEVLGRDILTLYDSPRLQRDIALYMGSREIAVLERTRVPQKRGNSDGFIDITVQRVQDPSKQPIGFLCIARDVTENVRLHQSLESLSITDELTSLYNQRHLFAALATEIERTSRFQKRLSLIFFDLDGFKQFNDKFGHLHGDEILKQVATMLIATVREKIDSCYRYGGDEFSVIVPETAAPNAALVAERIRSQVSNRFEGKITASIGIAEWTAGLDAKALIEKADHAMYAAKTRGRNCVNIAD